ncbi:formyltetrahydrofolate deformylase [Herbiconiux moechotypicola]|uniref:Formyltetrahydrofolate deformylase n=1 Tax=Herbiconiux moechotypicola TaxID=637393 RepID=A0ABP5Q9C8_9MICO|nr:formyltetrahydrofolate deformylase [Herbiconiux moechotypicola]MCS5729373.1 formyltetrahydrofolate deformylase [Herbiconiux moechotypicola]
MTITDAPPAVAPLRGSVTNQACLMVHGLDRPGIVAAISSTLARHGANIVSLDQHTDDPAGGHFYQRTVFSLDDLVVARESLEKDLTAELSDRFDLEWSLTSRSTPKRVIILASKSDHCLLDLLWRHRRGEIPMTVPMVVSNHTDLAEEVRAFGIPFFHVPSVPGPDKSAAEARIVELIRGNADLVVLARYMQILSPGFLEGVGVPVINIHHSFLPAFIGAAPYRKAKERGVKLIGATAHYVTEELDEGPIIEQDVVRVSHADSAADLQRRGADVERAVLSRAVSWHCDDRVIRTGSETIVF